MRNLPLAGLLLAAVLVTGCDSGPGNVLEVDATGAVIGVAFRDLNGNGVVDSNDEPFRNVEVRLLAPGTGSVIARASSDSSGVYRIRDVPVGRYQVAVDPARLGDSLRSPLSAEVVVTPRDSQVVTVPVAFPTLPVAEARDLPAGRRVSVDGRVVAIYGDTVHVSDSDGSIRAARVRLGAGTSTPDLLGDSVRILGTTERANGQPVLDDARLYLLAPLGAPTAELMASAGAATAADGTRDAALVQVRDATVVDTLSVDGQWFLRLDDGSGPVDLLLGARISFTGTGLVPGAVVHATGILVPSRQAGGTWWLRWRGAAADLTYLGDSTPFRPTPPADVALTQTAAGIRVTWTAGDSQETIFRIERRTGSASTWSEVGTAAAGATEFVDASAASNGAYAYRVRACNGKICSAPSPAATAGPA